MKTLKLIAAGLFLFFSSLTQAQVSINVNIGRPPAWGPAGYSNVDYYYLPDIETYYDIRSSQFIYRNAGIWVRSRDLPWQYRNYNLFNGYKAVLTDYHGSRPYLQFKNHKIKYFKGFRGDPQRTIGRREDYRNDNDHRKNNSNPMNNNNRNNRVHRNDNP